MFSSLNSERGTDGKLDLSTSGSAENLVASFTDDDGLSVREDSGELFTSGALDIHEVRVGGRDQSL